MCITKTLAKAKMDESIVKLDFGDEDIHTVKVTKLMGNKIEAYSLEKGKFTVLINDLVSVEIVKEKQDA